MIEEYTSNQVVDDTFRLTLFCLLMAASIFGGWCIWLGYLRVISISLIAPNGLILGGIFYAFLTKNKIYISRSCDYAAMTCKIISAIYLAFGLSMLIAFLISVRNGQLWWHLEFQLADSLVLEYRPLLYSILAAISFALGLAYWFARRVIEAFWIGPLFRKISWATVQ